MKEIYIIRHGETALNKLGIVQGRGINSPLNELGLAQGDAFYQYYKNIIFDKIYTSSLLRTQQTVQHFLAGNSPWEALADLDELAWGEWEGKSNNEAAKAAFKKLIASWEAGSYDEKFQAGESVQEVANRLLNVRHILTSRPQEARVLICMHGRALRIFLCVLLNLELKQMMDFPHQNTVLYKLGYENGQFSLLEANQTAHLRAAGL